MHCQTSAQPLCLDDFSASAMFWQPQVNSDNVPEPVHFDHGCMRLGVFYVNLGATFFM